MPVLFAFSQTKDSYSQKLPDEPATLLGLNPEQAINRFGAPAKVYAVRGAEAWQDDVVFEYNEGFSLFLYMEHVWQIRITESYQYPVYGFLPGSTVDRISASIGSPSRDLGDFYEWILPGEAWPVRMRAIKGNKDLIRELYVYRADF